MENSQTAKSPYGGLKIKFSCSWSMGSSCLQVLTLIVCSSSTVQASSGLTHHGRILNSDNLPSNGLVDFKIFVISPGTEGGVLFEETQTLGSGTSVLAINGSASTRIDAQAHTFAYVYGVLSKTCTFTKGSGFESNGASLKLGASPLEGSVFIDEWGIWNIALSSSEVTTIFIRQTNALQ